MRFNHKAGKSWRYLTAFSTEGSKVKAKELLIPDLPALVRLGSNRVVTNTHKAVLLRSVQLLATIHEPVCFLDADVVKMEDASTRRERLKIYILIVNQELVSTIS